ncbi:hypothetical protein C6503_00570 [Candidatus Poribacteria bacterium]|nr:MAG: hypothetical protein C6503_00570 [Candidatus Poribacteria bacterium]
MEKDDAELIQNILSGNETAFGDLVKKYQKSVHALAWRKIRDFHIAEEITQDVFLQAHKKLASLKNPNQFAGWLYVITMFTGTKHEVWTCKTLNSYSCLTQAQCL